MYIFQIYKELLLENRQWIWRVFLWAVFWAVAGFFIFIIFPQTLEFIQEFLVTTFEDILGDTGLELDLQTAWLIFRNNLLISVMIIFFGIALGLLPLFSVAVNFSLLGYLMAVFLFHSEYSLIEGIGVFLVAILPHGILEIPAFILAAAFGLRLGMFWKSGGFRRAMIQAVQVLPLVAVTLFVAALIEIYITGWIVGYIV